MKINIVHLYSDYLDLYGDKGNILTLERRLNLRGIETCTTKICGDDALDMSKCDILLLGGGSEKAQKTVAQKLLKYRDEISAYIENDGVLIATCSGYQMLGNPYEAGDITVDSLKLLDIESVNKERLTSDILLECELDGEKITVVGFENHSLMTDIKNYTPFGKVKYGYGNDEKSGFEGVIYKNVFATNLHGPLLPKNPKLCDIILKRAIKQKYNEDIILNEIDDNFEILAHNNMIEKIENLLKK